LEIFLLTGRQGGKEAGRRGGGEAGRDVCLSISETKRYSAVVEEEEEEGEEEEGRYV